MGQLNYHDLSQVTGLLTKVYAQTDLAGFPGMTAEVVRSLVSADLVEYNELLPDRCVLTQKPVSRKGTRHYPEFQRHLDEHPLAAFDASISGGNSSVACPAASQGIAHGFQAGTEFYRRLGVADQLSITFPGHGARSICVVLNRWEAPFDTRDEVLLGALEPHLAQAYRNADAIAESQARTESFSEAFATIHRGLISLNDEGERGWMTPSAEHWLSVYFGPWTPTEGLPDELTRYIQAQRRRQGSAADSGVAEPRILEREGSRLIIRFSQDIRGRQFLFLREERNAICPPEFLRLSLTPREGEVLYWICQGKTNPEIATLNSISPRTVHKHVEHILSKLKVESRASAMLTALESLDGSGLGLALQ